MSPHILRVEISPTEIITLRPLRLRDRSQWSAVRAENREWLGPWEATLPLVTEGPAENSAQRQLPSFFEMVRSVNREARAGRNFSFAIWHNKNLVGQITLGGVIYGALRGGHIGYWIAQPFAGRGITTLAVKAVTQFGFTELGLHRIEINLRPENEASRRVAQKAGYRLEGARPSFLHIDGAWRDHSCFVIENSSVI